MWRGPYDLFVSIDICYGNAFGPATGYVEYFVSLAIFDAAFYAWFGFPAFGNHIDVHAVACFSVMAIHFASIFEVHASHDNVVKTQARFWYLNIVSEFIKMKVPSAYLLEREAASASAELERLLNLAAKIYGITFALNMASWNWRMVTYLFSDDSEFFWNIFISLPKNWIKWLFESSFAHIILQNAKKST